MNESLLRPERRWSPRDPLHSQCASPGRAMTVTPEGLAFHDPDGADVAVHVLTALAFPEVWPGWRGNALIADFHCDFLQPGCPVLTCLIVMTGDTADGEKNFSEKRARHAAGGHGDLPFHRPYKRLGVEKGDKLRVLGVDQDAGAVSLVRGDRTTVEWMPGRLAARTGGVEVYRTENIELRQGDRIRWTRNDLSLGLVNSQTADVTGVKDGTVTFSIEDGGTLGLKEGDSQLRHIDHAWASTVHAFQGRTVDTVIAAMEAEHPHLTTQKSFYVEISRARHRAELVTDDRKALGEHLESATGRTGRGARKPRTGARGGATAGAGGGARTVGRHGQGHGPGTRSGTGRRKGMDGAGSGTVTRAPRRFRPRPMGARNRPAARTADRHCRTGGL